MAAITAVKRTSRGHLAGLTEGTDSMTLSGIVRTTAGAATAWDDAFVSSVTMGGGATASGVGTSLSFLGGAPTTAATAGGAVSQTGGLGNTTGAGGAWAGIGGAGGSTDGSVGGSATVRSGSSTATNGDSGNTVVDTGAATGTGTNGTCSVGATNAESVTIGRSGKTTTIAGDLNVSGATTTVSTTNLLVADDLIVVNSDNVGAAAPSGWVIERGSTSANDATVLWNEADSRFEVGLFASNNGANTAPADLSAGGRVDFLAANLYATAGRYGTLDAATGGTTATTFQSGDATTSGNSGAVNFESGAATSGDSGAVIVDSGAASGTPGQVLIGTTNAAITRLGSETVSGSVTQIQCGATGGIQIGLSTAAKSIDIGTGAAANDINIGSANTTTSVDINAGTGNINIGASVSTAVMSINLGTGGVGAKTVTVGSVESTSSTTINSGTGAINIGTTAQARATNIGTGAAAQTVTLGSTNTTSTTAINTGSGGLNVDANGNSTWTMFDWTITLDEAQATGVVGNTYSLTTGAGAIAIVGTAGSAGGGGSLTAGAGGAGQIVTAPQPGGAGGSWTITAGVGGASGGAASTAGAGGDVLIVAADAGATGAGVAGNKGRVAFTSGTTQYFLTAAGTAAGPALTTTAQTIIEAINEIDAASSSSAFVSSTYTTTGLTVGAPVYISATDTTAHGDADVEATSNIIGLVLTVGASGTVITHGLATAVWEGGLTGGTYPVAGNPVFLSTTPGRVTTVAPTGAGDTVIELGYVKDPSTLTATTTVDGDLAEIHFNVGSRVLV